MGVLEHRMLVRIHYGDTDAAGVVYYANYLRYIEGGRYEYIREAGIDLAEWQKKGYVFAVAEIAAKYHASARLGDEIEVRTALESHTPVSLTFRSTIHDAKDGALLFSAIVRAACLDGRGRPIRMPPQIMERLSTTSTTDDDICV